MSKQKIGRMPIGLAILIIIPILAASAFAQSVSVERWQGIQGGPVKAQAVAIENASDWRGVWAMFNPKETPPAFDSARHMGLAIALGQKPTTGYGIEVEHVGPRDGRFVVALKEVEPVEQPVGQAITSPWLILKFDRTNLPLQVTGLKVAARKR